MVQRDINRIFMYNDKNKDWFLNEWNIKSKEEKQEFISRYVESITFEKDPESKYGIVLSDIKLKSLYKEKISKLSEIGMSDFPINFISNDKLIRINVGYPLKESQIKKYLEELNQYQSIKFYIHPTFNYTLLDMPESIEYDLEEDEQVYKIIPIVRDIVNPDSIKN